MWLQICTYQVHKTIGCSEKFFTRFHVSFVYQMVKRNNISTSCKCSATALHHHKSNIRVIFPAPIKFMQRGQHVGVESIESRGSIENGHSGASISFDQNLTVIGVVENDVLRRREASVCIKAKLCLCEEPLHHLLPLLLFCTSL
ncbi:hypothetical protein V8G54_010490 [Vigna mungo]|uniref:Uncharacterized protein n=1 Tax=Vigna mungo TaxID=3915 RepID=A0AAQ3S5U3_VIGMU